MNIRLATPADVPRLPVFIDSVLRETGAQKGGGFDEAFYRWQYDVERDVIVIAEEEGRIVAHYPLVRQAMRLGAREVTAGVCQDLSVAPSLRGKGVFRQLGDFATDEARRRGFHLLWAFPNHRSIGGFLKHHGYRLVGELDWWATPVNPFAALAPGLAATLTQRIIPAGDAPTHGDWRLDGELADGPFERLATPRTDEYVAWRFGRRPGTRYAGLVESESGRAAAWAALRTVEIRGLRLGLVVDLVAATGGRPLARLLARARRHFLREGVAGALVALAVRYPHAASLLRAGFLPLPRRAAPRALKLVARALDPALDAAVTDITRWSLTLADWDVF